MSSKIDPSARETSFTGSPRQEWIESRPAPRKEKEPSQHHAEPAPSKREVKAYKELVETPDFDDQVVAPSSSQRHVAPVQTRDNIENIETKTCSKRVCSFKAKSACDGLGQRQSRY